MGKNSTIKVLVTVRLSITSGLEQAVKNSISVDTVKSNLAKETKNYAKLVKAHDPTSPGGKGLVWHYLEYKYEIDLDLYNLVKINSNALAAQALKLVKSKRKEMVMEKVRKGIEDGFRSNINSSLLNYAAVQLKSVKINELN